MFLAESNISFAQRIDRYPSLKNRMELLMNVLEDCAGDCQKASEAEMRVIEELRQMGSEALHCWAEHKLEQASEDFSKTHGTAAKSGKKKLWWHTTFGEVAVYEQEFRVSGQRFRPFSDLAEVHCRSCSRALQRVVTDFGADHAFGLVPKKLQEHYGINLSASTVRAITEHHAGQIYQSEERVTDQPKTNGCKLLIGEIDGSMIPIVKIDGEADDKRKNKTLQWKEARLCLVHQAGSATPTFGATFSGTVTDAGRQLYHCAVQAGFGKGTHLHGVGDGATWIADQIDEQFGAQGSYLVDFYHLCDYLAAAAKSCAPQHEKAWMDTQKDRLKQSDFPRVLEELDAFLEPDTVDSQNAPVRACYRYIKNRPHQLDYKAALDQGLPIGSGEIESAHRYIVQQRLKLPGAWWTPDNVDSMLALRITRANDKWDSYWNQRRQAA